ncbi:MAG: ribosome biogenesis GTPase YlqF [Desulfobacteraceae bacterium 4572_130]|nr:MAG: ribosome biogenesis GTPase YlqF [Desulfobacteraceae bacterium 4572_130]
MNIQWFPGHMQGTEQFLEKAVLCSDLVLEILDARLPVSSSNPLLDTICKNTARIKILNKKDLADSNITKLWLDYFKKLKNCSAIAITGTNISDVKKALDFSLNKIKKSKSRRIRIIVVGIPNTGKSTIINTLAGKKIAKTGNIPAITKHQQRTELKNKIDIYDTPGILWPNLEDKDGAYRLAVSGAISDANIDYNDIFYFASEFLIEKYPFLLKKRYKLCNNFILDSTSLLKKIGLSRGCLKKGGIIDYQKVSKIFIKELCSGKIGPISFETPVKEVRIQN